MKTAFRAYSLNVQGLQRRIIFDTDGDGIAKADGNFKLSVDGVKVIFDTLLFLRLLTSCPPRPVAKLL